MPEKTSETTKRLFNELGFRVPEETVRRQQTDPYYRNRDWHDYLYNRNVPGRADLQLTVGSFTRTGKPSRARLYCIDPKIRLTLRGANRIDAKLREFIAAVDQLVGCMTH